MWVTCVQSVRVRVASPFEDGQVLWVVQHGGALQEHDLERYIAAGLASVLCQLDLQGSPVGVTGRLQHRTPLLSAT